MTLPRLEITKSIRDRMEYRKFAGPAPRLLILESDYWLDGACLRAAERLGWETRAVPMAKVGTLPRDMVQGLIEALLLFRPDFVLSINLSGMDEDGLFARMFEDLRLPYVTWFVDDPRTITLGRARYASPYAVAFTWEAAYEAYLGEIGFQEVRTLPLAVDPALFDAEPATEWHAPPTFVGHSMAGPSEEEWRWIDERPGLARAVRETLDSGRVTRERFAMGLDALLPEDIVRGLDEDERRHAELLMFWAGTRRLRAATMQALTPHGVRVRGDEGWRAIVPDAEPPVDYRCGLAAFYRMCSVNLNITSIQMASAVNQRVFDCPAAGGFLLTDAQSALSEHFDPDREVACYGSVEECVDLVDWYARHPEARRVITQRARDRIFAEHTYAHRLKRMAEVLKGRFG